MNPIERKNENLEPRMDKVNLPKRQRSGKRWNIAFQAATAAGIIVLSLLLYTILNKAFGYAAIQYKVSLVTLTEAGVSIDQMGKDQLLNVLKNNMSANAYAKLDKDKPFSERSQDEVYQLVVDRVLKPEVKATWTLTESLFEKARIEAETAQKYPEANLEFISWINSKFINTGQSSDPLQTGIHTALMGSLLTILITIAVAFPLGVGAAIYLEEYATDNRLNRIIRTNINNLAGVPSIIYGMLGLVIFVRVLEPLTSGALVGINDPSTANGRTILSAGLTLALLILPLIIINSQEAIRTVPSSIRQASYGLGATRWQTIWHHVLPGAMPGILTGTILAVSRAIGETAPLVVVGAATMINYDPQSIFSKFTTLPIQIYQWTARPQEEFRNIAAAAIVVLLVMLLSLNAAAIIFRNRFKKGLV
jgi:phosphate transport system permease protein